MEKFEVIIVGGGLAGLAAAYTLANEGIEALVIERGDYPGSKNVTGGRIYLNPVRQYFPEGFFEKAPLERPVTSEVFTMMAEDSSTSLRFRCGSWAEPPHQSYTILRGKFDRWLGERAAAAGAMMVTKNRVDDLVWDEGKVAGVTAGGEILGAEVVLACDGALSLVAEKAKLRKPGRPKDYAVGFKEVIELPRQKIEDRFNLAEGEGAAQFFMGSLTGGRFGGGFLYTNQESLSLGMVVGIGDLMEKQPFTEAPRLLEEFKRRPEVAALIQGGELVEYSAHVIPEAGYEGLTRVYGDRLLVAGDAAGFALNLGVTVRGMEFALASGVIAARAVKQAFEKKDFSVGSLSKYGQLLKESFVLKDMETFRAAPEVLDNPRFFNHYPQLMGKILQDLLTIGDGPKEKLSSTVLSHLGVGEFAGIVKDLWKGREM
ncbi:MAG: FAD-dependent oxidoreductase [Firmicutes bacterium]|nr:FAD-dependent oxidoreductase [Bacillota bacterium]